MPTTMVRLISVWLKKRVNAGDYGFFAEMILRPHSQPAVRSIFFLKVGNKYGNHLKGKPE